MESPFSFLDYAHICYCQIWQKVSLINIFQKLFSYSLFIGIVICAMWKLKDSAINFLEKGSPWIQGSEHNNKTE